MQNIPGLLSWQPLPGEGKPLGISLPRNCQCFLLEPPIINPNEGCTEGSVWKWIWKAGMEPHGTNPCTFIPAKAPTHSRWTKPTGGRVGAAEFHMDCLPSASPKQNHSIIQAGKGSQSISQSPWRNEAWWWGLARWKHSSDFNFCVHAKGKKKKRANPIISCWKHWRVWMSHKELEVPVGSFLWLSPFVPVSQMSCPPHWKAVYQWLGFNHWKGKSNLLTLLCCLSSSPFIPQPPPQILVTIHVAKISAVMSFQAECKLIPLVNVNSSCKAAK